LKYDKLLAWLVLLGSLFLLALPRLIPTCTGVAANGSPMLCHYTYQAEFLVALVATILAGALFALKTSEARLLAGFTLALLAVVLAVLPAAWASGICANGACGKTAFFTVAGAGVVALAAAVLAWINYRRCREDR